MWNCASLITVSVDVGSVVSALIVMVLSHTVWKLTLSSEGREALGKHFSCAFSRTGLAKLPPENLLFN